MILERWVTVAVLTAMRAALPLGTNGQELPALPPLPTDIRPAFDIEDYGSYAWNKNQVPAENMANHLRIINAVQAEMKELGYRLDTIKPQARIQYRIELKGKVVGRSTQERSYFDDANSRVNIDFSRERLADFSLELVDAETGFLLWQSKGEFPLGTPDRAEQQIREAVDALFEEYPTRATSSSE